MKLIFSGEISSAFRGLCVSLAEIRGVDIEKEREDVNRFIRNAVENVKQKFSLESLVAHPLIRVYRDFFWRIGVDPTKTRPSSEALLRRVLQGKEFPRINSLVDVYNVVSMTRIVPIAAFDSDTLFGELVMRFAVKGELFFGIGMQRALTLSGKEVVVQDDEKLIAVYPYRDAESSKVTSHSRNVLLMVCGVPGVTTAYLEETCRELVSSVLRFCGGELVSEYTVAT